MGPLLFPANPPLPPSLFHVEQNLWGVWVIGLTWGGREILCVGAQSFHEFLCVAGDAMACFISYVIPYAYRSLSL